MTRPALLTLAALSIVLAGCARPEQPASLGMQPPTAPATAPSAAEPASDEHALHNVIRVSDKIISGAVPEGDAGFDELAAMGVRTVLSVDGAAPDVERARARGMRYVHLPVGYHGIDGDRQLEIARAVRDLPGPVYIHCHHGKHRGPAAAASAAVALGALSADEGVAFMKRAGTADHYAGLYACVAEESAADAAALDAAPSEFPEVAPTPGFVKAMAEAQMAYDHLVEVRDAGWTVPAHHPDLVPIAEAGRLADLLRVGVEDERVASEPEDFAQLMLDAAGKAQAFEDALAAGAPGADLTERLKLVGASCKACHVRHRDRR